MPNYTATIGGVDRTAYINRRTLRRDQSLDGKADVLAFSTRDGSWQPETGQEVLLEVPSRRLFGGEIRRINDTDRMARGVVQITCADWLPRLNRRLVWANFTGQTAGAIVRALFGEYAPEFTLTGVEDGPVIEAIGWQGVYLSDCIDELARLAGFLWRPDYFKDVIFRARRKVLAPYAITDAGSGYSNLAASIDRTQLVTRVIVQGGRDVTDPQAYAFRGDGSKRSFGPFQFPLAAAPTVLVNGVAKTVGIGQVDTGKDFYWNEGSLSIEQDDSLAPLAATDTVSGTFKGYYPYRMEVDDPVAIMAVKAIEGGDGVYEKLLTVDESTISAQARLQAQAELMQYAHVIVNGSFQTLDMRWEVGQLVTIQTTKPALDGQYLVLSVSMAPEPGWDGAGELRWLSTVTFGTTPDDWLQVFQAALRPPGLTVPGRANDVVMRLASITDSANAPKPVDSVTWSTYTFRRCSVNLKCSEGLIL